MTKTRTERILNTPHGTATTEGQARRAANGCHVILWYDGRVTSVWRYTSPRNARRSVAGRRYRGWKFRKGYRDKGLTPPARPWRYEIV